MTLSRTLRIVSATAGAALLAACSLQIDAGADADSDRSTTSASSASTTSSSTDGSAGTGDEGTARAQLAELTVADDGSIDGYDRDHFPHWSSQGEGCDTREVVLRRDGEDVEVDSDCYPTSGTWTSPYDGETWTDPSDVDIDHMVPLAEAWRSGADEWTDERREEFANDLDGVNLLAVTDNVNQSKSDQAPEDWKPPSEDYWCTYAIQWIDVKHTWELTVERDERTELESMLQRC
ncbi:HNH endonuclease [Saccharomonospora piscinae]|uniref:HNH endonuclease family protein n=1 Tax=Saccharomonospora piscinae TaxID=687388 RepID=UPI0011067131|nr:HNH endonuclease family protein [Saccharomonospora piscinae]TLW93233.1 HNH endonuclease [Saccharomonospora piscinae]